MAALNTLQLGISTKVLFKNSAFDALVKQTLDFFLHLQTTFTEHC